MGVWWLKFITNSYSTLFVFVMKLADNRHNYFYSQKLKISISSIPINMRQSTWMRSISIVSISDRIKYINFRNDIIHIRLTIISKEHRKNKFIYVEPLKTGTSTINDDVVASRRILNNAKNR